MRQKLFPVLVLAIIIVASGCVKAESIKEENFAYSPPNDYYSLSSYSSGEWGYNYTYNSALGLESITINKINLSLNRSEYKDQVKFMTSLGSSSFFDGKITGYKLNNNSQRLWAERNGTVNITLEGERIKAREYQFAAFHKGDIYEFNMLELIKQGSETYEADKYKKFRESVMNAEFK